MVARIDGDDAGLNRGDALLGRIGVPPGGVSGIDSVNQSKICRFV